MIHLSITQCRNNEGCVRGAGHPGACDDGSSFPVTIGSSFPVTIGAPAFSASPGFSMTIREVPRTDTWTSPEGKTYRMIRDEVLIRMQPEPEEQNGVAILHSRQSLNNTLRKADVLAVGPGKQGKRGRAPTTAKPGDVAIVPHLCGHEVDEGDYDKTKNFGETQLVDALRLSRLRIVPESVILAIESDE